jgi:integrase
LWEIFVLTPYLTTQTPPILEFVKVSPDTVRAFMDAESARGLAPKTWNDTLKLLRTTFKRLHPQLNDGSNPFRGLITKATETVNRDPFPVPVLKAILEVSVADPFIRPIIVTGICTAMRRGDCCLLKWADVDLEEGFITVKTSKTGETVDVPLFPMLRDLLREGRAQQGGPGGQKSEFCFPEAAAMYEKNPDGITWRVKQVLAAAFRQHAAEAGTALPDLPAAEVRQRGVAYLDTLPPTKRTRHMRDIFDLYTAGKDINEVMVGTGLSRGSVSGLLNNIERNIKCVLVRGKVRGSVAELLQEGRGEKGDRRASVYDFHSFRVTWITLALAAGVPLELVQRVTGHRTVEIVLKHYFRPGREDFRETILSAMPELLTAPTAAPVLSAASGAMAAIMDAGGHHEPTGAGDVLEEALKALEAMNAKNWRKQRDVVAGFVRQAKGFAE